MLDDMKKMRDYMEMMKKDMEKMKDGPKNGLNGGMETMKDGEWTNGAKGFMSAAFAAGALAVATTKFIVIAHCWDRLVASATL